MNDDNGKQLLEELENLLKRQIDLAQRGSLADLLKLAGSCEAMVAEAAKTGLAEKPEYKNAMERLGGLYRRLQLVLSAQQNAAAEQLRAVRKGKKTLSAYRNNV
jgi:hypothetical protein